MRKVIKWTAIVLLVVWLFVVATSCVYGKNFLGFKRAQQADKGHTHIEAAPINHGQGPIGHGHARAGASADP